MATQRRGFGRERHAVMKAVMAGIALSGFIGSWVAFASAHPAVPGDQFETSQDEAALVVESLPAATESAAPILPTVTPTSTATPTAAAPTATATPRISLPQQGATQVPIAPTSTPLPSTPVPATPTTATPTATPGTPKPTATRTAKKTRAS